MALAITLTGVAGGTEIPVVTGSASGKMCPFARHYLALPLTYIIDGADIAVAACRTCRIPCAISNNTGYAGAANTLITCVADNRCSAAGAIGAYIISRAGIVVIAGPGLNRVGAYACCTGARIMALIEGGANYRRSDAVSIVTCIACRAGIIVIAGPGLNRVAACA